MVKFPVAKLLLVLALFSPLSAERLRAEDLTYCEQGLGAQYVGNYNLAIVLYTRCLTEGDLTPGNQAMLFYDRGTAYGEGGDYDRAIRDLDQAILLEPDFADAFNNRGVVYRNKGYYDRAIRAIVDVQNPVIGYSDAMGVAG